MAIATIIHKSRLQRGFHPRHLGQIDVAFELSFCGCFIIEINQPLAIDNDDAGFFRMRRVNQHTRRHIFMPATIQRNCQMMRSLICSEAGKWGYQPVKRHSPRMSSR